MDEQRLTPAAGTFTADRDAVPPAADLMERQGSEWGLASLLTGGMLAVGAQVYLVLAVVTIPVRREFTRFDVGVIFALHSILTVVIVPMNLLSFFAGLRGTFSARRRGQPVAYGVLGLFMSVLAFGLWVCACVAGFAVLIGD